MREVKTTTYSRITGIFCIYLLILTSACNTTKYVPDGEYLLNEVKIDVKGEGATGNELLDYVQQLPNSSKFGVGIYNLVDSDSSWFKKTIRKMGEPAVIFRRSLVPLSETELTLQMKNLGYLNAEVTSEVDTLDKKANVTYTVVSNDPYRIRNYTISLPTPGSRRREGGTFGTRPARRDSTSRPRNNNRRRSSNIPSDFRSLIKENDIFNMEKLESERQRANRLLQNQGYYKSSINNLHFWADTTLGGNQVDLTLGFLDSTKMVTYKIEKVNVYTGAAPRNRRNYIFVDSLTHKGIHIHYDDMHFLRKGVITDKVFMRPGGNYRLLRKEITYNQLRALGCVGRVDVQYVENNYPDSTLLDCNVYVTAGNIHSLQVGVEGTNKDGDLGTALDINYGHLNIFNGSEVFNVNFRAAYEFVNRGNDDSGLSSNYYEFRIKPSLTFPKLHLPFLNDLMGQRYTMQTQYSIGYDIQKRAAFTRTFFNLNWKFNWAAQRKKLIHSLSLIDINFIHMPWKSDKFQDYLNTQVNDLARFSYEDIFTAGIIYNFNYTTTRTPRSRKPIYSVRFNAETSGNLLNGLNHAFKGKKNDNDQYTIFGNPFAQYVKGDIELSGTYRLNEKNTLAGRFGVGVAYPYGNSTILPFEKRYYAGGPNSVRGWKTRYLGPGTYNKPDGLGNVTSHVGDINLITSFEYRFKAMSWFEPAFFVDAGNIWTIKDYEHQPGGKFEWDSFHKEIAVGTGIGFRLDLSFLIVRLDLATKVVDPARENGKWVLFKDKFFKNSAFYFAIGYPF